MSTNCNRTIDTRRAITFGNLALKEQPVSYEAPILTVVEGGHGERIRHADPFPRQARAEVRDAHEGRHVLMGFVAMLMVLLALAGGVALSDMLAHTSSHKQLGSVPTAQIVVHEGDSLWAIAEDHPLEGLTTRDVVIWIEQQNSLDSALIAVGQSLVVPSVAQL